MSMRHNRNALDVEEGISDFKTPVQVEGTKKLRSKQSAWVSMFFYIFHCLTLSLWVRRLIHMDI